MSINILINHCYLQVCQEALKNVILINKLEVLTGHIYKITDSKGKKYIGSTNDCKKRWKQHEERICPCIELLKIKELKKFHLR